jgi:5-methylcytosine-specific restriction protein A
MRDLEKQFHEQTLRVYELGKTLCGYNATRFLQKIRSDGGVRAAKGWLDPKRKGRTPTGGFLKLVEAGRLDISLEALVLREPWSQLFVADELTVATERLRAYGYAGAALSDTTSTALVPEEVTSATVYEGAKTQVTVNSYERRSKARKRCIEHLGTSCTVCGIEFGEVYGENFEGLIHVHHLRPLASIGTEYELDPVNDLRPVCPNCHAVMHKKEPPYTVHQVKTFLKRAKHRVPGRATESRTS